MGWDLPKQPGTIELFVDGLIVPAPDWQLYRVPWYVPTAAEAARAGHGDCESKAILLASLLAGKRIPFEVRASLNHIWVDYAGRRPRPGESRERACLEGPPGRFRIHWPSRVDWEEFLAVQREQLWTAMPPARKALWLVGLLWVGLASATLTLAQPEGQLQSNWRIRGWSYLGRSAWMAALVLGLIAVAPALVRGRPSRWTLADLYEVLAAAGMAGALLAWLSVLRGRRAATVSADGSGVTVVTALGGRRRRRELRAEQITHLQLDASAGGLRPWVVAAALRSGERVPLVHHRREEAARDALRSLGAALRRPLVVRADGFESRTLPEEISRSLPERAARRPSVALLPKPAGCDLQIEEGEGRWVMRYPASGRSWPLLLGLAAFPVLLAAALTYAVVSKPLLLGFWAGWVIAVGFLGLVTYLAVILRGEVVARLADARVEIRDGELRFFTPEQKVETLALDRIETVELGRIGESPTVVVVSPERVLHLRDLCPPEHRAWVRQMLELGIVEARREAAA
jgi:hypothetical protein